MLVGWTFGRDLFYSSEPGGVLRSQGLPAMPFPITSGRHFINLELRIPSVIKNQISGKQHCCLLYFYHKAIIATLQREDLHNEDSPMWEQRDDDMLF